MDPRLAARVWMQIQEPSAVNTKAMISFLALGWCAGHAESPLSFAAQGVQAVAPATQDALAEPERFVSSTLKFAMAELGRTSPGGLLRETELSPRDRVRLMASAGQARLALTRALPDDVALRVDEEAVMARDDRPAPVAWHVASAR
jgi:hypothetical protein